MKKFCTFVAGVSALAITIGSPATAQVMPRGAGSASEAATAPPETMPVIGRSLEDRILVRGGDPEAISNRRTPPRPARYLAREDEHTELTRAEWRSRGWSEERFDAIRQENYGLCVRTTVYLLRVDELVRRYEGRVPLVDSIANRYVALGDDIRTASRGRTGANILATIIGFTVSTATGGIVGAGALGNELQGQAWDESMVLNRDAGLLNTVLLRDHIDFNLLALDMYADYLDMTNDYCIEFLGKVPAPVDYNLGSSSGHRASSASISYNSRRTGPENLLPGSYNQGR